MILESPSDERIQLEVDRTFKATRASLKPIEYSSADHIGGHYRTILTTGLTTVLNAGDAIASMRWQEPDRILRLHRIRAYATLSTAFGTAQETSLDIVRVNNFQSNDTGGTAIALGTDVQKGPGMSPSRIGDLRIAGVAALGAGTGTAEANPFGKSVLPLGNALGASAGDILFECAPGIDHPMYFATLQGFRIRIGFTQGATGVVRFSFVLDWSEAPVGL